ncbi:sugar transferase [Flavihumibacter rivuli]|uniref:sugar transferase n=1 Tax=Flavihumibacter rivuli TaxID=2838156 RepID=UPI001BDEB82C|nr:sugar transferase [Flavihumibacter rivuli]ULQ58293.1 sugar transferase [Flavihumibacter rivuli]
MEQTMPLNLTNNPSTYKRYSVLREVEAAPIVQIHSREFFLIGKNSGNIDLLVNFFDGGYAAENVEKALNILERIASQKKIAPTVIFIDHALDRSEVTRLRTYLRNSELFKAVPLILHVPASLAANEDRCSLRQLFDDVIDLKKADEKLLSRVDFLGKIKKRAIDKEDAFKAEQEAIAASIKANPFRRSFDILFAFSALVILSPLMLLIALAIKLESRGPVFYISKRAGRGYRIFNFFKFRTMEFGADKQMDQLVHLNEFGSGAGCVFFKVSNDPRATRLGKFLRKTSLDELPQLINVLIGDMSIVGNRPLPLYEAAMLTTDEWAKRFMAPAGITGLWQIRKNDRHFMNVEERIKLDIEYSQRQNFLLDLWIMAKTPPALIQKSNPA